jgi:hypothetical protein
MKGDQFARQFRQAFAMSFGLTLIDDNVLALHIA